MTQHSRSGTARAVRALNAMAIAGLAALGGCVTGPDYVVPTAATAPAYKELENGAWVAAQPADTNKQLRGAWWELYDDPVLTGLETKVAGANQNVIAALAHYRGAQAEIAQIRSQFFPIVSAGGDFSSTRTSQNVLYKSTAGITVPDYLVQANASWEPDLWGRVARGVEGARANAQASAADADAVLLSMQAELATDYFELRGIDAERRLLDDTIRTYQEAVELTQHRLEGGIATEADVAQALTQLQTTQAQAIDLDVERTQLEHAIAILIGETPSSFTLPIDPLVDTGIPVVAPAGVPSALLERRPDIAAAERRVAAANAQIGVATAAFFPNLILAVTGGLEATNYSDWLVAPARFWSLGPTVAETVLDFGARSATKREAIASYDESVAQYRQTVLDAFGQVEDNLAALRVLEREALAQDEAVASAKHALDVISDRYKHGAITYLDVVVAQTTALVNEREAVDIARRRMAASVALIKALGGGWNASKVPTGDTLDHARHSSETSANG
jgi:NodT family efflux transporter outer membrane factor (OMF) lipoprotein